MMNDATELATLVRTKQISPVEIVKDHLRRMDELNPKINAIVTLLADEALQAARQAEAAVAKGDPLGPLHGVPFTVKDALDTAGVPTQRGSLLFKGRVPDEDATAVARLKAAGGILLAKTNLPEFSFATESDNRLTGRTNNPYNLERTPGGSSGGESAAIAAGMSPLGLGSDVAISVRGPAAHTGIVGLKATHGRIPVTGHWPRAPRRLWHVGPMARTVRDIALAYSIIAGPDGHDGYANSPIAFDTGVGDKLDWKLRIGWLVGPGYGPVDPDVAATVASAAKTLQQFDCEVEEVAIPELEKYNPLDLYSRLHILETKPAFKEVATGREDELFKIVATLLQMPDTPIASYVDAEQSVEKLKDAFASLFGRYDALICPVTPFPAPPHGLSELVVNGETISGRSVLRATVPFNLTGLPALSMRFGTSRNGLPVGVQVAARWFAESTVLHIARLLESVSPVRDLRPVLSASTESSPKPQHA